MQRKCPEPYPELVTAAEQDTLRTIAPNDYGVLQRWYETCYDALDRAVERAINPNGLLARAEAAFHPMIDEFIEAMMCAADELGEQVSEEE